MNARACNIKDVMQLWLKFGSQFREYSGMRVQSQGLVNRDFHSHASAHVSDADNTRHGHSYTFPQITRGRLGTQLPFLVARIKHRQVM